MSTICDDPCANLILDFIAGPESAGNYNAGTMLGAVYAMLDKALAAIQPKASLSDLVSEALDVLGKLQVALAAHK